MPEYEFYCRHCKKPFSASMHVEEHERQVVECPQCHDTKEVEKRISEVYVMTSKKS